MYTAANVYRGVVDSYDLNLPPFTPWYVAQGDVLRMLPKDARVTPATGVTVFDDGYGQICGVFSVGSVKLAKTAGHKGIVQVTLFALGTGNNEIYNPENVQSVTVSAGASTSPC